MFFKRKDKPSNDEIKRSMDMPEEETAMPIDLPPRMEIQMPQERPTAAPLFVKVEKYQHLLESMNEMRSYVSNMKQLFNVLYELESTRSDTLKIMRANIQRFEKSLMEIDNELLRPKGLDIAMPHTAEETHHIEESLGELQRQLSDLRKELSDMK